MEARSLPNEPVAEIQVKNTFVEVTELAEVGKGKQLRSKSVGCARDLASDPRSRGFGVAGAAGFEGDKAAATAMVASTSAVACMISPEQELKRSSLGLGFLPGVLACPSAGGHGSECSVITAPFTFPDTTLAQRLVLLPAEVPEACAWNQFLGAALAMPQPPLSFPVPLPGVGQAGMPPFGEGNAEGLHALCHLYPPSGHSSEFVSSKNLQAAPEEELTPPELEQQTTLLKPLWSSPHGPLLPCSDVLLGSLMQQWPMESPGSPAASRPMQEATRGAALADGGGAEQSTRPMVEWGKSTRQERASKVFPPVKTQPRCSGLAEADAKVPWKQQDAKETSARRWCCLYLHMQAAGFDLVPMIIGKGGRNTSGIAASTGAKVRVRGEGSGHLELNTGREAPTPLMLVITAEPRNHKGFLQAVQKAVELLAWVEGRYRKHCCKEAIEAADPGFTMGVQPPKVWLELRTFLGDLMSRRAPDS